MENYHIVEFGTKLSKSYGFFLRYESFTISAWHDIPLYEDTDEFYVNMVVEIPRWTNAKFEISKGLKLNPIKQDIKKGKLRYIDNVYPYKGYIWNYGAIPQTWEDPNYVDPDTHAKGDNDPLDICEIGQRIYQSGSVIQVKPLGILAMMDKDRIDWKVIAIAKGDPLESKLNDISDIETLMPGLLDDTKRWFKLYKIPQGKPANKFAYNGEFKNKDFARRVIEKTNESWQNLIRGRLNAGNYKLENSTIGGSPFRISRDRVQAIKNEALPLKAAETTTDPSIDIWHFITE